MTDEPTVSVIIPAYNAAHSLAHCVDTAVAQQGVQAEIIVINDGSTDATAEIAAGYGDRIRFLQQPNGGQGAARNTGLQEATGEYIAFLDADDFWVDGFLSTCAAFLQANPEAVAVNTGYVIRRWGQEIVGPAGLLAGLDDDGPGYMLPNFFDTWGRHDHVRTGTVLIRREVIDLAGGQRADLRISQDLEYWAYLATFGPWGFIPRSLWVGDSVAASAASGWMRHYRKRRRLCPTVEQWQERILPRLTEVQLDGFAKARGRVAAGYAQSKILGGDRRGAREIVARYGAAFPLGRMSRCMRLGHRAGFLGWSLACTAIRAHEYAKSWRVGRCARRAGAEPEGN